MAMVDGVRNFWSGYVALRQVHAENDALKHELQTLQVRLQEERAEAQRTDNLRQLLELRERAHLDTTAAEVIAAAASPRVPHRHHRQGHQRGLSGRHGRDLAGRRRRPRDPAERPRREGAAADRPQRRGRRADRAHARAGRGARGSATVRCAWQYVPGTADVKPGDLVVTSGIDGIYPEGLRDRHHRAGRARHGRATTRSRCGRRSTSRGSKKCWSCGRRRRRARCPRGRREGGRRGGGHRDRPGPADHAGRAGDSRHRGHRPGADRRRLHRAQVGPGDRPGGGHGGRA